MFSTCSCKPTATMVYTENADDDIAEPEDEDDDDEVEEITNQDITIQEENNNNNHEDEEDEGPFHGFDPQIVSVKSISNNNNNLDNLNGDSNGAASSTSVSLSKDIFDRLCQLNDGDDDNGDGQNDDLADIQIEPNIIDYEGGSSPLEEESSKTNTNTPTVKATATPATIVVTESTSKPQHTPHIPIVPVPAAPKTSADGPLVQYKKKNQLEKPAPAEGGSNTSSPTSIQLRPKPITELTDPKPKVEEGSSTGNVIITPSPMVIQQQSTHPTPPPPSTELTCSFCNCKFTGQTALMIHLTSSGHINVPSLDPTPENIADGYLTYTTTSQGNPQLKRIRSMCLSCGKTFGKVEQVKIHLNVHYGDNIYTCRFCEKVFTNFTVFDVSMP